MIKEYWILSYNNLKHRGIRSWLTLLGIFIGVMAVVALIGLGTGLQAAINSQFGISATDIISVEAGGLSFGGPPGTGAANSLTTKEVKAIEKVSNVEYAIRRNIQSGKLEFNKKVVFGLTTNIPDGEEGEAIYEIFNLKVLKGKLLEDGDTNKVVLGYNFYADKVGLEKKIETGDNVLVQDKKFKVIGITEKKGSFIFDNLVYMNEKDLLELFEIEDEVDLIAVKVKDNSKIEKTKDAIAKAMRKSRGVKVGEEDFKISTPQASIDTVNKVLFAVNLFVLAIAAISVFVGAIGIVNTMTTSVIERRKEIGIMKAIGAKNSQIFLQFFIEAGLLGLIGGILGAIFGTIISIAGMYAIGSFIGTDLTVQFNIILIIVVIFSSFLIGAISGVFPAMKAARQNPVEALRG